jgi:glutamine amidotransferase
VIALLDYGSGNLRSVHKSLLKVGAAVRLVQRPEEIGDAAGLVLPGVGAFDDCIHALREQELLEAAKQFITTGKPFLGICVGYQALFEKSEEFNSCAAGLGVFNGKVVRFPEKHGLKIPQIGWNQLEIMRPDCPLYRGIASGSYVYFVHSFFPQPAHGLRRTFCFVRLARQCFRHAIPSGKKPEDRPATAEEFRGSGENLKPGQTV